MIANTILQQLGGHGFTVMTGSRNYINLSNGLQMSLARNKTSANRLKIILDEGGYFDMLQQIFTDVTGLYTRL